ncbi:hypothetical protein [Pontibacter ruber]|uniref:Uncharacterized protein n=1 Tax=Pontibacter ruber TaxID=1343895 RepID=A0ABW5D262_9BACT|nr:hypothetical protein [Pontibacter ruber]
MIDLHFTSGTSYGSGNLPAVKPMLRTMKAILYGTATTAVKPAKKARQAQHKPQR